MYDANHIFNHLNYLCMVYIVLGWGKIFLLYVSMPSMPSAYGMLQSTNSKNRHEMVTKKIFNLKNFLIFLKIVLQYFVKNHEDIRRSD